MTAVRNRSSSKGLAFVVALMTILALVVPFAASAIAQTAEANDNTYDLQVSPEVDQNPTGTTHTLTATINTAAPAGGVEVDFEAESGQAIRVNCTASTTAGSETCAGGTTSDDGNTPTTPDLTCTIAQGNNSCQVFFTSDTQGTVQIRAFVDDDKDNSTQGFDATEGRFAGGDDCVDSNVNNPNAPTTAQLGAGAGDTEPGGGTTCDDPAAAPGSRTETDDTDVVQKTFGQAINAACIDAEPETDTNPSGSEHTITARVTNSSAAPVTDTDGTFDCLGSSVAAGTRVTVTITDDDPNIFIKSVGGTATGGPSAGGPNTATATTDANGEVRVVIQCVSGTSANCTGTNSIQLQVEGAQSGAQTSDTVQKTWQVAGTAQELDATPETDTNEVGQTHVITCSSTDAFGNGVAGTNCDAQVTAGPNADNNIGSDLNTTNGFVGQCTTAANGTCTISYTSTEIGTDQISVFSDLNNNDTQQTGGGQDENDITAPGTSADNITKTWVAVGQGTNDVDIDMSNTAGNQAECDDLANGTDDANDDSTATNPVNTSHEICAERFGPDGTRDEGPITFTITSGPGTFFNDANNNGVRDTNERDLGNTVTVQDNEVTTGLATSGDGFNRVNLSSSTAGTTTIQACVDGSTTVCATGTKTFAAETARNITLTAEDTTPESGEQVELVAKATDRFGNPVPGVTVTFTETGTGRFSNGTSSVTVTTDANGEARVSVETDNDEEGTQTITATITDDDPSTNGNQTSSCTAAAGTPAGTTTAGNCSDTETITWTADAGPGEFECNDRVDNDGDGDVDFPDDANCTSATDNSEGPFVPAACRDRGTSENVIVGTNGADVLSGTSGRDVICGAGGDDVISARGGADLAQGNGGDDTVGGGGGKDNLSGNGGNDNVSGNKGNDAVKGNGGQDTLKGNAGIDSLTGGKGNDSLQGGDGDDIVKGGAGNDTLRGGAGADLLDGGSGNDGCFGNAGADKVKNCE